jgi:hypothetical protein
MLGIRALLTPEQRQELIRIREEFRVHRRPELRRRGNGRREPPPGD